MRKRKWKIRAISLSFLILAGGVLFKVLRSIIISQKNLPEQQQVLTTPSGKILGVSHSSFSEDSNNFSLKSSEVDEVNKDTFHFKNLESDFKISETEKGKITADESQMETVDSKKCDFNGNVKLTTESGLTLETEKSFVDFDKKISQGDTDIRITQDKTDLTSKKYFFDMNTKTVVLTDQVKGNVNGNFISTDKLTVEFDQSVGKDVKRILALGKSLYKTPHYSLKAGGSIEYTKDRAKADKNVVLLYKKDKKLYDIKSSHMDVDFSGNSVKKVTAYGKLVIKTEDSSTIKGEKGVLEDNFLTVTGNVIISDKRGVVFCDKVVLDTETNNTKIYNSKGIINKKDEQ